MKVVFCYALPTVVQGFGANELDVHEHWFVSQRMTVEMGDYAWSEHIVTVFLACQITMKNVQLTVKGKTTPINQRNPKCQNIDELRTAI
jgi:hypothetical protein